MGRPAGAAGEPHWYNYPDRGCQYCDRCLECPYPLNEDGECLRDWHRDQRRWYLMQTKFKTIAERNRTIMQMHDEGKTLKEIAEFVGLTVPGVHKIIKNKQVVRV